MVFETTKAPNTREEFIAWFMKQAEWGEDHDYETIGVSSPALQNWFMEMKEKFPPMNGEYAPDFDEIDEETEEHTVDYCIGQDLIYAGFAWSVAEEAYEETLALAKKHKVGFFDVSTDDGEIILPDGTMIE
jgi:hypothetical protein